MAHSTVGLKAHPTEAIAMTMKLWELAGAEADRLFSPYCWRIRMALAHKGLEAETLPWRFTDTDKIAFSGQGLARKAKGYPVWA